ncbi:hypothetical protein NDU88_004608 [Pleurodeles waltl]|uniref:Uncharacterized protein n=1 Tax=Pleurodeles waltl TaxID=8319 RepID=A0AAV7W8M7_PLEWA|nr:hypothetical protein NDU88_004608 [Pleurodeles waltl]
MGKDKGGQQSQANKIVNYTQVTHDKNKMGMESLDASRNGCESQESQEPSMSDILKEIRGTRTELVTKIDTVAVDVTLLYVDLGKVVDRVAEDNIGYGDWLRDFSDWAVAEEARMKHVRTEEKLADDIAAWTRCCMTLEHQILHPLLPGIHKLTKGA